MNYHRRLVGLILVGCVGWLPSANAGVVLGITPPSSDVFLPTPGNTTQFSLEVQIAADAGTQLFRGYGLPIDLSPPEGTDPPIGWSVISVDVINAIPGDPPFAFELNPPEGDLFASDSVLFGDPVSLDTNPLSLFSFTVELSDQAVAGSYLASFVEGASFSVVDENGDAISPVSLNSATIQLSVIPEPSNALLGVLSILGVTLARRRRYGHPEVLSREQAS